MRIRTLVVVVSFYAVQASLDIYSKYRGPGYCLIAKCFRMEGDCGWSSQKFDSWSRIASVLFCIQSALKSTSNFETWQKVKLAKLDGMYTVADPPALLSSCLFQSTEFFYLTNIYQVDCVPLRYRWPHFLSLHNVSRCKKGREEKFFFFIFSTPLIFVVTGTGKMAKAQQTQRSIFSTTRQIVVIELKPTTRSTRFSFLYGQRYRLTPRGSI